MVLFWAFCSSTLTFFLKWEFWMILFNAEATLASNISKLGKLFPQTDREDFSSANDSTISTSLIHNRASGRKSVQVVTWFVNLTFQHKNVAGVRNLSNWSSDICCLCCPTMEFCGISTGNVELMVDGLLANVGIGIVRSSQSRLELVRVQVVTMSGSRGGETLPISSWIDDGRWRSKSWRSKGSFEKIHPIKNYVSGSCVETSCNTVLRIGGLNKHINRKRGSWARTHLRRNVLRREYCVASSARQRPRDEVWTLCGKTSALPHQKMTRRQADQTSSWTHPESHKLESSAQQRPGVKWRLVAEAAEEEQSRGRSAVKTQGMTAAWPPERAALPHLWHCEWDPQGLVSWLHCEVTVGWTRNLRK